jgi:uncharacterized protein involved in oxidation of intracellular sulfur
LPAKNDAPSTGLLWILGLPVVLAVMSMFAPTRTLAANAAGAAAAPDVWRVEAKAMKLGIVIYSTDSETVWNAFRFGGFALKKGDSVKVFLLAKGVDCEKLNTKDFDVTGMMKSFVESGGKILACGTCLTLRNSQGTELCPISTMKDMYDIVKGCDKVLTF